MARVRTVTPDGVRIRELRLEQGLTPEQLVERLPGKRHAQTIRRLERGAIDQASEVLIAQIALALKTKAAAITKTSGIAA